MPEYDKLDERYRHFRHLDERMNDDLLKYTPMGQDLLPAIVRKLGLSIHERTILFDSEAQMDVLTDCMIYDCYEDGLNAVDRYMAAHPSAPGSDEQLLLDAKKNALYRILSVRQVLPGIGVQTYDVLNDENVLVLDHGFSRSAFPGLALATRTVDLGGFHMTTGAAVPVPSAEALEAIVRMLIEEHVEDPDSFRTLSPPARADLTARILRLCFDAGAAQDIEMESLEEQDAMALQAAAGMPYLASQPAPLLASGRIGRNEPCPCGSGKKYKKCCGRNV